MSQFEINLIEEKPDLRKIDEQIVMKLFGWQWIAFNGTAIKSDPDYPKARRVRRLCSPQLLKHKDWKAFFADNDAKPADGSEMLAYCYCSFNGPEIVPHFSDSLDECAIAEKELKRRKLLGIYEAKLKERCPKQMFMAPALVRCQVMIEVLDMESIE